MTRRLLFLTIILSPIYIVRRNICCFPIIEEYPTNLLEILIFLTFSSFLVDKIIKRNFQFSIRHWRINFQLFLAIGLFLLSAAISVFISPDKRGALGILKAYYIEPIVLFFIVIGVVREKRDWYFILRALLLSGFWVALLAIIQKLTGRFVFAPHEMSLGRAHSVYNSANAVGLFVGPLFAISLGLFLEELISKSKITIQNSKCLIYGLLSLVYFIAILFTKSRGALIGIGVVILTLFGSFLISLHPHIVISELMRRFLYKIIGFGSVIALLIGIFLFLNISRFTPQVDNIYERPGDSKSVRLCLWEGTKNLIKDRPIFGAGLSGFKDTYEKYYLTCDAEPLEYPHNIFLNFWVETGLLGLVSFLFILYLYFKRLLSKRSKWSLAFVVAMFYLIFHGLVDVPYFKNDLSVEFWVILALAVSPH